METCKKLEFSAIGIFFNFFQVQHFLIEYVLPQPVAAFPRS